MNPAPPVTKKRLNVMWVVFYTRRSHRDTEANSTCRAMMRNEGVREAEGKAIDSSAPDRRKGEGVRGRLCVSVSLCLCGSFSIPSHPRRALARPQRQADAEVTRGR